MPCEVRHSCKPADITHVSPDQEASLPNGKRISFDDSLREIEGGADIRAEKLETGVDPPESTKNMATRGGRSSSIKQHASRSD